MKRDIDIKKIAEKIQKEEFPTHGTFITIPRIVSARKVTINEKRIIDKNGEEHIGVFGDWEVWDGDGNIFFKDKRSFRAIFTPYNEDAFKLIQHEGYEILIKLNEILNIQPEDN